ncbi:hypothetical protein [Paenibacillus kandeliae]|uniref:hypothetical protein n=1 Tax=Paenibacillus kandeliae TaxID=3231269 RepID=UPI00345762C9
MEQTDIQQRLRIFMKEAVLHYFKNPQININVILNEHCLLIRLHHFLDNEMENLVYREDMDVFRSIRELMMEYALKDIQSQLLEQFGLKLQELYYDWDEYDQSSMIMGMFQNQVFDIEQPYYPNQKLVHEQVSHVTYIVEKYPDTIRSFWADPHTLVMMRQGLLVRIEEELVKEGFQEILRKTKRKVEKTEFLNSNIESVTERSLRSAYLDWDFEKDQSVLVYSFHSH